MFKKIKEYDFDMRCHPFSSRFPNEITLVNELVIDSNTYQITTTIPVD